MRPIRRLAEFTRAALPFFFLLLAAVVLIVVFPELATWLPDQMTRR
ncbi:MAG: hypothetical protein V3U44_11435 [Alphaproteobacteria bacterium]